MADILVVGGAGYVGSHLLRPLQALGHGVHVLDNLSTGRRAAVGDSPLHVGDLGDAAFVDHVLATVKPMAVMHFAALIEVGESVRDPGRFYANNVHATQVLLDAMRRHGVDAFLFSSTAAIFGTPQQARIAEDHPCAPINPYGRSKWMVEQMLADYGHAYGLRSVCLRYFNAAGASPDGVLGECHEPESHLIPLVLQAASGRRASIAVFGDDYPTPDGTCVRDYVHVEDLGQAHRLALEHLLAGGASAAYNLGNGEGFSVREVIESARRVTGRPIATQVQARRAGDPPVLVADSTRARTELGWRPQYAALDTMIAHAWAWERQYPWTR